MKEQDRRAVEGMASCGISLEGLIEAFPEFSSDEITEIYNEINNNNFNDDTVITISRNCS